MDYKMFKGLEETDQDTSAVNCKQFKCLEETNQDTSAIDYKNVLMFRGNRPGYKCYGL